MPEAPTLAGLDCARRRGGARNLDARHRACRCASSPAARRSAPIAAASPGASSCSRSRDMAKAAAALIDLDGLARRILLCPPGWEAAKIARAGRARRGRRARSTTKTTPPPFGFDLALAGPPAARAAAATASAPRLRPNGCCRPRAPAARRSSPSIRWRRWSARSRPPRLQEWATFYDIRRYGGLQIFLRALAGQGSLRLSGVDEPVDEFLDRLGLASRIFPARRRIGARRC